MSREIFATINGSVNQCDKQRCFIVNFAGTITAYKVPCFFSLKKLIDNIDLESMVLNPGRSSDYAIVAPCGIDRVYLLNITQIVEFRELLAGAKAMIQLNSIIRERLSSDCLPVAH